MVTLIAILTILSSGEQITYKVGAPFPTEQLCQERAPTFVKFIKGEVLLKGLDENNVRIETKCLWNL